VGLGDVELGAESEELAGVLGFRNVESQYHFFYEAEADVIVGGTHPLAFDQRGDVSLEHLGAGDGSLEIAIQLVNESLEDAAPVVEEGDVDSRFARGGGRGRVMVVEAGRRLKSLTGFLDASRSVVGSALRTESSRSVMYLRSAESRESPGTEM
jgi:hypothetical protein